VEKLAAGKHFLLSAHRQRGGERVREEETKGDKERHGIWRRGFPF